MDALGFILDATPAAEVMFGCSPDLMTGRNIGHFLALDDISSLKSGRPSSLSSMLDGPRAVTGLRDNGNRFALELTLTLAWTDNAAYFTGVLQELMLETPPVEWAATTNGGPPSPKDLLKDSMKDAIKKSPEDALYNLPAHKSLHILLAEDHPVIQMLAGVLLGQLGHSHVSASNGQEALDAHARQAFDLILMDVMMPVMDGLSAMAAVREREAGSSRRTPIVVVTAHAMPTDRERMLAAGADGYVAKPLTAEALQAEISRVLGPA